LGFPFALNVIGRPASANRTIAQIPQGFLSKPEVEVYAGVAYSPDGKLLYVSTGDSGAVEILSGSDWRRLGRISLDGVTSGKVYRESFAGALLLGNKGRTLYVIDQANWRVVVIDTVTRTRLHTLATGVNPIALCLSPDGNRLYVANSGLFEYKTIPGADKDDRLHTGLHFPPFGFPSQAAQNGVSAEGREIPGLGDANDARGSSLWTYEVGEHARFRHTASLRLGVPIEMANNHVVGGAAPSSLVASATQV
jgi:YVTN family beta-propeller protein